MDPFTFFKEPRPLGNNPFPPNSLGWEAFEVYTTEVKVKLELLWAGYQRRYDSAAPLPEILELMMNARFQRLDILAGAMLWAIPGVDKATIQAHEHWLENLVRTEHRDVLELVNERTSDEFVPPRRRYFDEDEFTRVLIRKHQEYKAAFHSEVARLADQRLARTVNGNRAGEDVSERAKKRRAVVNPILSQIKPYNSTPNPIALLIKKSGIGKATGYGYFNGTRAWISRRNGEAIADELSIDVNRLPDIEPSSAKVPRRPRNHR